MAVRYANELGIDWIWEHVQQLAAELRSKLGRLPEVTVHDRGRVLCGIVSFTKASNACSYTTASASYCRELNENFLPGIIY